ncbi:MAG: carboxypeptidase regulatory-like domain-containing protein [Planctomycetota bacterium]|jgi:protocatechuate 3,4-dioxygenase beta subunit
MFGKKMTLLRVGLAFTFFVTHFTYTWAREGDTIQDGSGAGETDGKFMDFYAVHRKTKKPLTDVVFKVSVTGENYKRRKSWDEKTDSQGFCKIKLPDFPIETLRFYPKKEGFVPLWIMWKGIPTPPELPKVFTVTMEPSTTIGGIVKNERDEPIEGVAVGVYYRTVDPDAAENVRVDIMIDNAHLTDIKTDASGRWTFDKMPAQIDKNELRIFLMHPQYMSDLLRPAHIPMPITRQPSIESLCDLSAVMVMKEGLKVTGKVTDTRGNPITGAKIYDTEDYWWSSTKPFAETDAQGQFQANANPGTATWTVQAAGYAPDLRVVTIKSGISPVEIRLEPGRVIEGKVNDQAGRPIEGASIRAEDWRRYRRRLHLVAKTDAEGNFKLTDAPADEVTFDIGKDGYMVLENFTMKPDERKYSITLRPMLKVRGTVLDAQTGRPINKFTVTNGFDHEDGRAPQWDKHSVRTFTDGQYEMEYRQEIFTYRIRVDAEGYQTAVSDCIRPSEIQENSIVCDFKLGKGSLLEGIVLSPDGTPISGADVVISTDWLQVTNGKINSRSSERNLVIRTDINGKFLFKQPVSHYAIIVLNEQGCAKVTPHEFMASRTITLSPWGRIEGTLRIGTRPGVDKLIAFWPEPPQQREYPRINFEYEVQTDDDGHFAFTNILPGKGTVARATPIDDRARRFSYHIDIEIVSGRTTHVQIGGTGRPVIGKVVVPDLIENIFNWQYTDHSLRVSSTINPPYKILSFECDQDGSFRVEDVPAGDYCIYLHAYKPPPNSRSYRGERIGMLSQPFNIPEMPGGRSDEPLDLGELEIEVVGKSVLMPSLIDKPLPDLSEMKIDPALAQTKGQIILICFWDMQQRPSRRCITQLAKQAGQLNKQGIAIIAVQASKIEQEVLNQWVKKYNIPFPIGMVRGDNEKVRFNWGVKSLPWLILTDSTYVVCAEGFSLGELDNKLISLGDKQ